MRVLSVSTYVTECFGTKALTNSQLIITLLEITFSAASRTNHLTGGEDLPWAASLPELMGATLQRVCWKAASTWKLLPP